MEKSLEYTPTAKQTFITGLVAALSDILTTHPLWTIKTLQQQRLTNSQIIHNLRRNPLLAYNGVLSNAASMVPITTTRVFLSSQFENILNKETKSPSTGPLLFSSFVAGGISSLFGGPTELIRTIKLKQAIIAAANNQKPIGNSLTIASDFIKNKGALSLGNGLITIAIRDGTYTAAFFTGAPLLKEKLSNYIPNNMLNALIAYSVVSLISSFGNHPFDTIKTLQHSALAKRYLQNGTDNIDFFSICKKIIEQEGYQGFWRGYPPRGLRFLIGLIVKASCIDVLTKYWEHQNQSLQSIKVKNQLRGP